MKHVCSSTIVVPGPLHKLIPMDVERGIYMIAYTDNKGVSSWKNSRKILQEIARLYVELWKSLSVYHKTHWNYPIFYRFTGKKERIFTISYL